MPVCEVLCPSHVCISINEKAPNPYEPKSPTLQVDSLPSEPSVYIPPVNW